MTRFAILPEFKSYDVGLLVLRLGIGTSMLVFHGYGKLSGGPEKWEKIGFVEIEGHMEDMKEAALDMQSSMERWKTSQGGLG